MSATVFCTRCAATLSASALFCRKCGTAITETGSSARPQNPKSNQSLVSSIEADDLSIIYERTTPMPADSRLIRPSRTTALSAGNPFQLGDEVQHYRQKAGVQEREKHKNKGKGVSAYGLQQPYESVKRHSELYVVQAGQNAVRQPSSLELRTFNPREPVGSWARWIRRECQKFHGWKERKDEDLVIEDLERSAWVGFIVKGSPGPLRVTLPEEDGATVQVLLTEIPEKQRIVFVLPITVLDAPFPLEASDSEYLPDPLKLSIRQTRSTIGTHKKRDRKNSGKEQQHGLKRQKSTSLEETLRQEERETSWLSETQASGDKSDKDTIKLELPRSEKQPLIEEELAEKEKARKEVQDILARETSLRRSERQVAKSKT